MPTHNLPQQPTSFVGQADKLNDIHRLLETSGCRLLTLIGPGGIGKTRLAIQIAGEKLDAFTDGVYFAALQAVDAPELIIAFLANVLKYQFHEGVDAKQQLLGYIREKRMLLVLDNFEHLLDTANLVSEILLTTSRVKLLVTSREALNLREEWLYHVEGMSFPKGDVQNTADYSAMQLFVERARQVRSDFSLKHEQASVARIARLVEGTPLALELAATWLNSLSTTDIANQIQNDLDFLTTTIRDVPDKHRSIRAVFEHSWNMLSGDEQAAFMKLTVFRGGCTPQAAEQVTGAPLFTLSALVDKSWLKRTTAGRYELHELLRQYGEERLEASDNPDSARDAHSIYYLDALSQREADLKGRRQLETLDEIESDFANVRVAWSWAVRQASYDSLNYALESLYWFCVFRSRFQEGADLFRWTLNQLSNEPHSRAEQTWGRVQARLVGILALGSLEHEDVRAGLDSALAIARKANDDREIGFCLATMGELAIFVHDYARAFANYQNGLEHFHQLDDRFYMARTLQRIGICHMVHTGDPERAREALQESLDLARELGDQIGMANCLYNLGSLGGVLGNPDFEAAWHEALAIRHEMRDVASITVNTAGLASLAFVRGNIAEAKALAQEALTIALDIYHSDGKQFALTILGLVACIEENYAHSEQLLEQSLALVRATSFAGPFRTAYVNWGRALVACGRGEFTLAQEYVEGAVNDASGFASSFFSALCLPVIALIRIDEGNVLSGIKILSLIQHSPTRRVGWVEKWPLITRLRADLRAHLGEDVVTAAWERGKLLDLDSVIAELSAELLAPLKTAEQARIPISAQMRAANQRLTEPLTPREHEILLLIAQGLANRQIAAQLFIEVSTVKRHINNCYGKLEVASRTQAILKAQQLQLV